MDNTPVDDPKRTRPVDVPPSITVLLILAFIVAMALLVTTLYPGLSSRTRIALFMVESSTLMFPIGVWMLLRPEEFRRPDPDHEDKGFSPNLFRLFGVIALIGGTVMLAYVFVL